MLLKVPNAELRLPGGYRRVEEGGPDRAGEPDAWMGPDGTALIFHPSDGTGTFVLAADGRAHQGEGTCSARFAGRLASVRTFVAVGEGAAADTLYLASFELVPRRGASVGIAIIGPSCQERTRLLAALEAMHAPEP